MIQQSGVYAGAMKFPQLSGRELELGAKAVQALLTGAIIGVVVYTTVQIAPAYFKNYEFEKAMRNEVRDDTANWRSDSAIREGVLEKAHDLGLPLAKDGIRVSSSQKPLPLPVAGVEAIVASGNNDLPAVGDVTIEVSYAIPLAFPGHTFEWTFHFYFDDHTI